MVAPVKSVLFATNLSEECRPALTVAVTTAAQYQADLFLLHVIYSQTPSIVEQSPATFADMVETYLKKVLSEEKWNALKQEHEQEARQALIGKMSPGKLAQKALKQHCESAGIELESCKFNWHDLVVVDKNIPHAIINQAEHNHCGLIVMGSQKGFRGYNLVGSTLKGVLRKSNIPVLIVPGSPREL